MGRQPLQKKASTVGCVCLHFLVQGKIRGSPEAWTLSVKDQLEAHDASVCGADIPCNTALNLVTGNNCCSGHRWLFQELRTGEL